MFNQKLAIFLFSVLLFSVLLITGSATPSALAQDDTPQAGSGAVSSGGVDHPGTWYPGENLKIGDYFKYRTCHAEYKDCSDFLFSFWIEKNVIANNEEKIRVQVLVEDGNKIVKGFMDVGKIAPEPTGGSDNISQYRSVYKSSIVWLSSFATADTELSGKGPKKFSQPSWGKIANIGGEQVSPIGFQKISITTGEFDTIVIGWKSGGITSHIWVVDDFPFPVKASTWVQVTEGIPPQEYRFELLDYKENVVENPFVGFEDTEQQQAAAGCRKTSIGEDGAKIVKNTNTNSMTVTVIFGPEKPKIGCEMEWIIHFKEKHGDDQWKGQVHYDILMVDLVDGKTVPVHSAANDEGRNNFWSASGQVHRYWLLQGEPGLQTFALMVYGVSPEFVTPSKGAGFFTFDIDLQSATPVSDSLETLIPTTEPEPSIPSWIKNNAGWWAQGLIDDGSFVSGIQWLISNDVMSIPPTEQATDYGSDVIPDWIKNNAGWWSNGLIPDQAFVSGLQWLISNGIMKIT